MDREKVINELNTEVLPFLHHHCDMQCDREKKWISKMIITVHDALDLLKGQRTANIYKCPYCGTWVSAENVVRCKECKFGEACKNGAGEQCVQCFNDDLSMTGDLHMPDWFCADGERR